MPRDGALFFGLSAGSIMLGSHWVRWKDSNDNSTARLFRCTGIASVLCDTHAEAEDWAELKTAVILTGHGSKGYGIPTGGVLIVDTDGSLSAMEKSAVCYENSNGHIIKVESISLHK